MDLEQAVLEDKTFQSPLPRERPSSGSRSTTHCMITHQPLTPEDFIERYKDLQGTEAGKAEVYKWKLVKANHDLVGAVRA